MEETVHSGTLDPIGSLSTGISCFVDKEGIVRANTPKLPDTPNPATAATTVSTDLENSLLAQSSTGISNKSLQVPTLETTEPCSTKFSSKDQPVSQCVTITNTRGRNKKRRCLPPLVELNQASSSMEALSEAQKGTTAAINRLAAAQETLIDFKKKEIALLEMQVALSKENVIAEKEKAAAITTLANSISAYLSKQ